MKVSTRDGTLTKGWSDEQEHAYRGVRLLTSDQTIDRRCIVATLVENDLMIGSVRVWLDPRIARITDLWIHPEHRRQGYGSQLLEFCITTALREKKLSAVLWVEGDNEAAVKLYLKHGFVVADVNERKFYLARSLCNATATEIVYG